MSINEQMVQDIVQDVLAKMQIASDVQGDRGVFKDMNEAIEAAKASQKIVAKMSLDHREKVISNIRKKIKENAEILARMGVQETGMGNVGLDVMPVINKIDLPSAEPERVKEEIEDVIGIDAENAPLISAPEQGNRW